MVQFRRNLPPAGKAGGRLIALVLVVAMMVVGGIFLSYRWIKIPTEHRIVVHQQNEQLYSINGDTTNAQVFASALIDSVRIAKQSYYYIRIKAYSPRGLSAAQIADFMQVVQALDDGKRVSIDWNVLK